MNSDISAAMATPADILAFWFGATEADRPDAVARWFRKDDAFDAEIRTRFGGVIEAASRGELDAWATSDARSTLALVVVLDQFSRNVFRETPRSFAQDARALAVALDALDRGIDGDLGILERSVLLMPLMHAEDRAVQARSISEFAKLAEDARASGSALERRTAEASHDYAIRHRVIVDRFGRYPHRNSILRRDSTGEEREFLSQPGSSF